MIIHGKLRVFVVGAVSLLPRESDGTLDPYCKIRGSDKWRTTEKQRTTVNPDWQETLIVGVDWSAATQTHTPLVIQVWDWRVLETDELIGEVVLPHTHESLVAKGYPQRGVSVAVDLTLKKEDRDVGVVRVAITPLNFGERDGDDDISGSSRQSDMIAEQYHSDFPPIEEHGNDFDKNAHAVHQRFLERARPTADGRSQEQGVFLAHDRLRERKTAHDKLTELSQLRGRLSELAEKSGGSPLPPMQLPDVHTESEKHRRRFANGGAGANSESQGGSGEGAANAAGNAPAVPLTREEERRLRREQKTQERAQRAAAGTTYGSGSDTGSQFGLTAEVIVSGGGLVYWEDHPDANRPGRLRQSEDRTVADIRERFALHMDLAGNSSGVGGGVASGNSGVASGVGSGTGSGNAEQETNAQGRLSPTVFGGLTPLSGGLTPMSGFTSGATSGRTSPFEGQADGVSQLGDELRTGAADNLSAVSSATTSASAIAGAGGETAEAARARRRAARSASSIALDYDFGVDGGVGMSHDGRGPSVGADGFDWEQGAVRGAPREKKAQPLVSPGSQEALTPTKKPRTPVRSSVIEEFGASGDGLQYDDRGPSVGDDGFDFQYGAVKGATKERRVRIQEGSDQQGAGAPLDVAPQDSPAKKPRSPVRASVMEEFGSAGDAMAYDLRGPGSGGDEFDFQFGAVRSPSVPQRRPVPELLITEASSPHIQLPPRSPVDDPTAPVQGASIGSIYSPGGTMHSPDEGSESGSENLPRGVDRSGPSHAGEGTDDTESTGCSSDSDGGRFVAGAAFTAADDGNDGAAVDKANPLGKRPVARESSIPTINIVSAKSDDEFSVGERSPVALGAKTGGGGSASGSDMGDTPDKLDALIDELGEVGVMLHDVEGSLEELSRSAIAHPFDGNLADDSDGDEQNESAPERRRADQQQVSAAREGNPVAGNDSQGQGLNDSTDDNVSRADASMRASGNESNEGNWTGDNSRGDGREAAGARGNTGDNRAFDLSTISTLSGNDSVENVRQTPGASKQQGNEILYDSDDAASDGDNKDKLAGKESETDMTPSWGQGQVKGSAPPVTRVSGKGGGFGEGLPDGGESSDKGEQLSEAPQSERAATVDPNVGRGGRSGGTPQRADISAESTPDEMRSELGPPAGDSLVSLTGGASPMSRSHPERVGDAGDDEEPNGNAASGPMASPPLSSRSRSQSVTSDAAPGGDPAVANDLDQSTLGELPELPNSFNRAALADLNAASVAGGAQKTPPTPGSSQAGLAGRLMQRTASGRRVLSLSQQKLVGNLYGVSAETVASGTAIRTPSVVKRDDSAIALAAAAAAAAYASPLKHTRDDTSSVDSEASVVKSSSRVASVAFDVPHQSSDSDDEKQGTKSRGVGGRGAGFDRGGRGAEYGYARGGRAGGPGDESDGPRYFGRGLGFDDFAASPDARHTYRGHEAHAGEVDHDSDPRYYPGDPRFASPQRHSDFAERGDHVMLPGGVRGRYGDRRDDGRGGRSGDGGYGLDDDTLDERDARDGRDARGGRRRSGQDGGAASGGRDARGSPSRDGYGGRVDSTGGRSGSMGPGSGGAVGSGSRGDAAMRARDGVRGEGDGRARLRTLDDAKEENLLDIIDRLQRDNLNLRAQLEEAQRPTARNASPVAPARAMPGEREDLMQAIATLNGEIKHMNTAVEEHDALVMRERARELSGLRDQLRQLKESNRSLRFEADAMRTQSAMDMERLREALLETAFGAGPESAARMFGRARSPAGIGEDGGELDQGWGPDNTEDPVVLARFLEHVRRQRDELLAERHDLLSDRRRVADERAVEHKIAAQDKNRAGKEREALAMAQQHREARDSAERRVEELDSELERIKRQRDQWRQRAEKLEHEKNVFVVANAKLASRVQGSASSAAGIPPLALGAVDDVPLLPVFEDQGSGRSGIVGTNTLANPGPLPGLSVSTHVTFARSSPTRGGGASGGRGGGSSNKPRIKPRARSSKR